MSIKPHVLYLEDLSDWGTMVRAILGEQYEVMHASTLSEAKNLLDSEDFSCAIVDTSLIPYSSKDTSGFEFIRFVRSTDAWSDLPVIVLTGYDFKENMRIAFRDLMVKDFVSKDELDPNALQSLVADSILTGAGGRSLSGPARALVVEDAPEWQNIIRGILEEEGCEVEVAANYAEAIDRLISGAFHLATVDIRLKDLDDDASGIEAIRQAKRLGSSVDTIFISGYGTKEWIYEAAFEFGARDFIDKGRFDPQSFRFKVRQLLRHLIHVVVRFGDNAESPVLKLGQPCRMTVSMERRRPLTGVSRSLARPVVAGPFELEVVAYPYDMENQSDSVQVLKASADDSTVPVQFRIVPRTVGNTELRLDLIYKGRRLGKMWIPMVIVDEHVAALQE